MNSLISSLCTRLCILSFASVSAVPLALADVPATSVSLRNTGLNPDGDTEYLLEWNAVSNRLYRIQQRDGFESNTTWQTIDVTAAGRFKLTPDKQEAGSEAIRRKFFRLEVPSAEIFSIEPAIVNTNGGTIYIRGQELPTNGVLRIGDLVLPATTLQAGTLYSFTVPPLALSEGTYDVDWMTNGVVVAKHYKLFSVTGQPTPVGEANGQYRLVEPPAPPPAAPFFKEVTGLDVYIDCVEVQEGGKNDGAHKRPGVRVMPFSGELQITETDFHIPGRGLDFVWTRTYRSRTGINSTMGQGWSHSYDIRCVATSNSVTVWDGTGRSDTYFLGTNGVYTANELFNVGTFSNGVFTLEFPDTGKWEFNSISNVIAPGSISRSVDRNANAIRFTYNGSGQLTEVIDTLNRTNRIAYNGIGKVDSVTDFSGRTVSYVYWTTGADGGLRSVTSPPVTGTPNGNDFPSGKTTQYWYTQGASDPRLNNNLTRIIDPKGQLWLEVNYTESTNPNEVDFDRVRSYSVGGFELSVFGYTPQEISAANRAVMLTTCNDPVGNVKMQWFDSMNRCIVHRDLAARAVPGTLITLTNLPKTKLRDSDPDFWETRFEWNLDSLCTRITHPRGNVTEMVYQGAFNQNASRSNHTRRHDGDTRVIREIACCGDVDGDGLPLTLTTYLTHDPRFGSVPIPASAIVPSISMHAINTKGTGASGRVIPTVNKKHAINTKGTGASGRMANVKNNPLYQESGMSGDNPLFQGNSFVIKVTDPRGNVDTFDYDAKGNCVRAAHQGHLLSGDDKPVADFEYNAHGQLTAIVHPVDANGVRRRDERTYYNSGPQNGYLHTVTIDALGVTLSYSQIQYTTRGMMTARVDPRGYTNRWIYNQLDQVVQELSPNVCAPCGPTVRTYFYDANDNVVQIDDDNRDGTGALVAANPVWTSLYEYDTQNRPTLVAHELAHVVQQGKPSTRYATNRFVYDAIGNLIEHRSPEAVNGNQPGNVIVYEFDTRNFAWRQTEAPGTAQASTDEYRYDANGNCVRMDKSLQDANSQFTTRVFDSFDRCVSSTDAMGNVTKYTYDRNGNLVSMRVDGEVTDEPGGKSNKRLSETRYEYDSLNRLTRRTEMFFSIDTGAPLLDGTSSTAFSYAPNGACRSITDDNGNTTHYTYDNRGRCISITDAKQNTVASTYDSNGNILTLTQTDRADAGGTVQTFVTSYEYDPLNRCVLDYDNVGNTNRYAYDSLGNQVAFIDPRGVLHTTEFDGAGRELKMYVDRNADGTMSPNERLSSSVYDDNGRLISSTDANTNTTIYAYDARNRCSSVMHADGTTMSLIWSPRSNLRSRTDANGTQVQYTYDSLDRCVRKDVVPGAGVASTTTFETFAYDGMSRLVLASNDVSRVTFAYDSIGNCIARAQDDLARTASFDGLGNMVSLTYPSGRIVNYQYDSLNRISNATSSASAGAIAAQIAGFGYEGPRISRIARGNSINSRISVNGELGAPNAPGDFGWQQVSLLNHQRAGGNLVIDRRALAYDRAQNKIMRAQLVPFAQGQSSTTNTWTYNALSEMRMAIKSKGTGAQVYEYELDENGNRRATTLDGVVGLYTMDATSPEPADFQVNQYTTTPFGSSVYDRNGNLVSMPGAAGSTDFSYDYANRLVSVTRHVGPATVPVVSYSYDAIGNRISKTSYPPAPASPITTVLFYGGDDCDDRDDGVIEEFENGSLRKTHVFPHVLEVSGRVTFAPGRTPTYTICDELGTALALTDDRGTVLERYDYDDFGYPHFLTSDGVEMVDGSGLPLTESAFGNRYLFRGMEWEGETGFYINRDYRTDPYVETAQRCYDPRTGKYLQNPQSEKRNTFADNNPWSAKTKPKAVSGPKQKQWLCSNFRVGAHGDPIHGVDVKLGIATRNGWGSGGGGAGGSISIDEPGVHITGVLFNPREYTVTKAYVTKEEGGRHTPFHNKLSPIECTYYEQSVLTSREAGSGMATGRRSFVLPHVLETSGRAITAREAGSGMATGRCASGNTYSLYSVQKGAREAGSGMATGRTMLIPHVFETKRGGSSWGFRTEVRTEKIKFKQEFGPSQATKRN
jgi:YD repeat-containing protein